MSPPSGDDVERNRREFTLQARALSAGRTFNAPAAIEPFVRLLGLPLAGPVLALAEVRRVLRPGAVLVLGDIAASDDPAEARLHNALETLRDPSHHRLLPEGELRSQVEAAGFRVDEAEAWENAKSFDEWAAVVEDARSVEPLREVMESLRRADTHAGIDLRREAGALTFTHHWRFIQARAI